MRVCGGPFHFLFCVLRLINRSLGVCLRRDLASRPDGTSTGTKVAFNSHSDQLTRRNLSANVSGCLANGLKLPQHQHHDKQKACQCAQRDEITGHIHA